MPSSPSSPRPRLDQAADIARRVASAPPDAAPTTDAASTVHAGSAAVEHPPGDMTTDAATTNATPATPEAK